MSASSSSLLNIIFFGASNDIDTPLDLMEDFMKDKIGSKETKKKSETSYTYEVRPGEKVRLRLYYMTNLDREYGICLYADAYVVLIDLERLDTMDKLKRIVGYIKESCSYDVKTYIIGKYNNSSQKLKELEYEEMNNFLTMKNFLYHYSEINLNDEQKNLYGVIEELMKNIYENKKNQLDSRSQSVNEDYDMEKGRSQSQCKIM